ncbi:MAG: bifunctional glutamate N-acetyltransferase/amino-acid acetyltransferase ArgJ [Actinomycetota bacterium]
MSAGVTYPRGFRAAGVTAGFKPSGQPDLALLLGDPGTSAAGLFTTNRVAAAPVQVSKARLAAGRGLAVLVNSGQANAATGQQGVTDALGSGAAVADLLGLPADDVLTCSTGVIGEPVHMVELLAALPALAQALSDEGGADFARAIMTTDTVAKTAEADAGALRVGGAAKGVGMISPNLATMLSFVTTDAQVERAELRLLADAELKPRFNAFSVDGCTSTNDTVLLFASGAAGGEPLRPGDGRFESLAEGVATVADALVSQLIHDGEGATHVLLVDVEGAASDHDARQVAKAVADSPLVKTAAFGGDPNPGRILQAVGSSGVDIDPSCIDVWIGDVPLAAGGTIPPAYFSAPALRDAAKAAMQASEFVVRVRVGEGPGHTRVLGCDLSYEYVRINGEYTT